MHRMGDEEEVLRSRFFVGRHVMPSFVGRRLEELAGITRRRVRPSRLLLEYSSMIFLKLFGHPAIPSLQRHLSNAGDHINNNVEPRLHVSHTHDGLKTMC